LTDLRCLEAFRELFVVAAVLLHHLAQRFVELRLCDAKLFQQLFLPPISLSTPPTPAAAQEEDMTMRTLGAFARCHATPRHIHTHTQRRRHIRQTTTSDVGSTKSSYLEEKRLVDEHFLFVLGRRGASFLDEPFERLKNFKKHLFHQLRQRLAHRLEKADDLRT
jgi:hypothetical protein